MAEKKWIPLEANPDVINEYIENLGFPTLMYKFIDVISCDDWCTDMLPKPVLGFLFLYKTTQRAKDAVKSRAQASTEASPNIYYMKQTISNACGTIGLMHILTNAVLSEGIPLKGQSFLEKFINGTLEMDPEQRGRELEYGEGSEIIEIAHRSAARSGQSRVPNENERISLHFTAIVPKDWGLYELDGRAGNPIFHGNYEDFAGDACQNVIKRHFFEADPYDNSYTILALVANTDF